MLADVAQQHRNGQPAADGGGDYTRHQRGGNALGPHSLRHLDNNGGQRDRHTHEKAETRRTGAIELQQSPGRNGGARARDAGNQRQHLGTAHNDRITHGDFVEHPCAYAPAINGPQEDAHDHERHADNRGRAKRRFGEIVQQQPANTTGNGGDTEIDEALVVYGFDTARGGHVPCTLRYVDPLGAKIPPEREEGSQMQRHIKGKPGICPPKQVRGERQMRRAGNRQQFGKSLHEAQHHGLKNRHAVTLGLKEAVIGP